MRARPFVHDETRAILMAPWRMLESDHDSFLGQLPKLEKLLKAFRSESARHRQILKGIQKILFLFESRMNSHFRAEESAIFPYLRRHAPQLAPDLLRFIAEHRQIRRAMAVWKRTFRKAAAEPSQAARESAYRRSLALFYLLNSHVQSETRLMNRFVL